MSDISVNYSKQVEFKLQAPGRRTLVLKVPPIGWRDDQIEIVRNQTQHGIFTQFTNSLEFYGDSLDYIYNAYKNFGINAIVRLTKSVMREVDDEVKMVVEYSGIADLGTIKKKDGKLTVKFNSNFLAEVLKSHGKDDFEIERLDSIDDEPISELEVHTTELKGRSLGGSGESKLYLTAGQNSQFFEIFDDDFYDLYATATTELISRGDPRHSSVDINIISGSTDEASQMFFVDTEDPSLVGTNISVQWSFNTFAASSFNATFKAFFRVLEYNSQNGTYIEVEKREVFSEPIAGSFPNDNYTFFEYQAEGSEDFTLEYNQGVMFCYQLTDLYGLGDFKKGAVLMKRQKMVLFSQSYYDPSPSLNFVFVDQCLSRLLEIITGDSKKLISKYFGRKNDGYTEDGEGAYIGLMHGFWARAFDKTSDRYKSLTTSLDKAIKSVNIVFNTGMGITYDGFNEIVRVEDLRYFYQDKVVVRLERFVQNEEITLDEKKFYSGIELGYSRGGNYENEIGLDEPNTKTSWVTPIRRSSQKFKNLSTFRADEYGLELARRKPMELFRDEDTEQDDGIWFLDLKETEGEGYTQKDWPDRLQQEPTGILSPETFRSFFFSPLTILRRHAWYIKGSLEPYYNKLIKYTSSLANTNLSMLFIGDTQEFTENQDLLVNDLSRSVISPEISTFTYDIDDKLWDLITGTTKIEVNGSFEDVPNFYFKFEWKLEDGTIRTGYIQEIKGKGRAKFKMMIANEKIRRI
mgnify:CR=1 FL=1|tara:strand:- start:4937 stop:7174 length:2238 start_codon:yes stop_codon:yes gene_type:complete